MAGIAQEKIPPKILAVRVTGKSSKDQGDYWTEGGEVGSHKKFSAGIVGGISALSVALIALGIGFSSPVGENSKLAYSGSLWCISNYIQDLDSQGKPVFNKDGQPKDDPLIAGKGVLIRRDQVEAKSAAEAEQKAIKSGIFEKSNRDELRNSLKKNDTDFFVTHFNSGATSSGPCLGNGVLLDGFWINDVVRKQCFNIEPSTESLASGAGNFQEQLRLIANTTVEGSAKSAVNENRKKEIIYQIKMIYMDLVRRYPEIVYKRLSAFSIVEEDASDPHALGHIEERENTNKCMIGLDFEAFGEGKNIDALTKNSVLHEFLHCWGVDLPFNLGEEVVWPISSNYSGLTDTSAGWYKMWKIITDIFIKRGDQGDRWRILMAVIGEGRNAIDKRLSYLPLPKGDLPFSSASDYLDHVMGYGDEKEYEEAMKWLNSKTPPPADYKTYKFYDISQQISAGSVGNAQCQGESPNAGPSSGSDYRAAIIQQLNKLNE